MAANETTAAPTATANLRAARPGDEHLIEQHDAKQLAEAYSPWVRALDVLSVVAFLGGESWLAWKIAPNAALHHWSIWLAALVSSYVFADFISGLFHWMGDTWGTPSTPFVGKVFVRPFREHHVDQLSITRHDFIEVNGANCLISLPPLLGLLWLNYVDAPVMVLAGGFGGMFLFWIFLTNQFHSWAHQASPPRIARLLQRWHLILPPGHHQVHHAAPYMKYYCITSGWLNEPLNRTGFFRALERLVSAVTGLVPRQDDIGEKAALAISQRDE